MTAAGSLAAPGATWAGSISRRGVLIGGGTLLVVGGVAASVVPIDPSVEPSLAGQLGATGRIALSVVLTITALLGPGFVLRERWRPQLPLVLVALPGLALLSLSGGIMWALAPDVSPHLVATVVLLGVVGCVTIGLSDRRRPVIRRHERFPLAVAAAVFVTALGRSLWSLGPTGELYGGTISRTLEVGDRSDSRISFHVVQLVAHGTDPYSTLGLANFLPYNFSSRGPVTGLASAVVVLGSGGHPPVGLPDAPWTPFDPQGFMAYRIAMMAMACLCLIAVWAAADRLAGREAARFATLLAATTPFVVHEVWFTWPKLLAAFFVLLALLAVLDRRHLAAGGGVGVGYLVHPGALLSFPLVLLCAIRPVDRAPVGRHRLRACLAATSGVAVLPLAWRILNGAHDAQGYFVHYLARANRHTPVTVSNWVADRIESVANTLIPLRLFVFGSHDPSVNAVAGPTPGVVHFFFQYWNTVPFGFGIVLLPMLVAGLWSALRRRTWMTLSLVVVPFAVFALYWGSYSSGLLREGLQAWALCVLVVLAVDQADRGYPWLRSAVARVVLSARSLEVLAVAVVPAVASTHRLVSARYLLTDTVALVAMTGATLSLGLLWYRPVVAGVDEASGRSTASTPPGPLRPPTDRGRSGPARVRRRPPGGTG